MTQQLRSKTVLVVDDDNAVRDSLKWLIESVGLSALLFASADEMLNSDALQHAGCILLDVRMPGISGLELQERLNARGVTTPVIVITGHGDVPMAVRAMKAGAMDFIEKPFSDQLLLDEIYRALEKDAQSRKSAEMDARILERFELLSPRERTVMAMVVEGMSNKAVAAELGLSQKTVEVHRARVMTKLRADSLAQLVRFAVQLGLART
jgi:RNA polymerase sigma factor (sigma-70 family)